MRGLGARATHRLGASSPGRRRDLAAAREGVPVRVKARYRLWVTPAERDAITRVLAGCPGQALLPAR